MAVAAGLRREAGRFRYILELSAALIAEQPVCERLDVLASAEKDHLRWRRHRASRRRQSPGQPRRRSSSREAVALRSGHVSNVKTSPRAAASSAKVGISRSAGAAVFRDETERIRSREAPPAFLRQVGPRVSATRAACERPRLRPAFSGRDSPPAATRRGRQTSGPILRPPARARLAWGPRSGSLQRAR